MIKFGTEKTPYDILTELAQKHKALRKQCRLSQSELASRSGVSLGSIKRFENTGQISLESLLKLAQLLNRIGDFELIFKMDNDLNNIEKLFSDRTKK